MGKTFQRITRGLVATVGAFAISVAMSGSASATEGVWVYDTTFSAEAKFFSYGEHFRVTDVASDGHSAVGRWRQTGPDSTYHYCWDADGANGNYNDCNYALPEGAYVYYEACIGEYGTRDVWTSTCGPADLTVT
ncbi:MULTISPECIES: hypothetical protein [unclassified Streptomyces]|uniref:hypothetical protein n=1 Tax=unclassified Streptomyces TaxID=2593676 RepID=UPI000938E77C|nr:hypothetical protein [Streptomyces sp. CB02058]